MRRSARRWRKPAIAPPIWCLCATAYMSQDSLTEKCTCFIGRYTLSQREHDGGGLGDEGEDIEVLEMGLNKALAMIGSGEIADAKTIMLLQALTLRLATGSVV